MYARNRRTGSPIVGTLETLQASARTLEAGFNRDKAGAIEFNHEGYTDVYWNSQQTLTRQGETVFVDEAGDEVVESEIELSDEEATPFAKPGEAALAGARPALDTPGRETSLTEQITLHEVVHPDGNGHGAYPSYQAASEDARPCDRIAKVHYVRSGAAAYTENEPNLSARAWAIRNAIERLAEHSGDGGAVHLLGQGDDNATGTAWLRAVTAGLAQLPQWMHSDAGNALNPETAGERWWAKLEETAAGQGVRYAVEVPQASWEQAMAPADEIAIYTLRKRLAEARRVHIVTVRNTTAPAHGSIHVELARQRLEMTMTPVRIG